MALSQQRKRKIKICGKKCSKTYSLLSFFFNKYRLPLVLCWPFCVFCGFQVDLEPSHAWSFGSKVVLIPGILLALALISAPTYFVTTLKWRFLKEKLKASLYYPASVISALWLEGKDRWRGEGDKAIRVLLTSWGGGGRGRRVKSWPYFRPKNVIFHSHFGTQ